MHSGNDTAGLSRTGYREASSLYRVVFGAGLLVLVGSIVAGFVQSFRVLGGPPLAVDATVLGRALFAQGDYRGAFAEFRLASAVDPETFPKPPELAYPAPSHPQAARLVAQARAGAQRQPEDAAAHLRLARALLHDGAYDESIKSGLRARDLDDGLFRLHMSLGRAQLLAGNEREAEIAFREALEREPENSDLHRDLAAALYRMERLDEAAVAFERARELAPEPSPSQGASP